MDQELTYRLHSRHAAFGQVEDYFKWMEDGYRMGERIGEGRPFEVRCCLVGGVTDVLTAGQVDEWCTIRMELFVFMDEVDRKNFLEIEAYDRNFIYAN